MLVTGLHDHELLRARWRRVRSDLQLVDLQDEQFALGGVAAAVPDLSVRFMILPADPELYLVEFDAEFWNWWRQDRPQPFGNADSHWGMRHRSTASAAVRFEDNGRGWRDYIGLHRSGALEFGLGETGFYEWSNRYSGHPETERAFRLVPVVGRVWAAVDLYRYVLDRYPATEGPWELTLALRGTQEALLGGFAEGWREPHHGPGTHTRCTEQALLLRREVMVWPDGDAARELVFSVGAWVEDAWGSPGRRFLAERGEREGEFDHEKFRWRW